MSNDYGDLFEKWEVAVAKNLINEFKTKWDCLKKEDFDDLLQECLSHWYFSKVKYDCKRKASMQTYMGRVLRHKLTDMVRERTSDKRRSGYEAVSLNEPIGNDKDSPTLLEKLDADSAVDGDFDPSAETGLKRDLSKALRSVTDEQRSLCRMLGEEGLTVKEAAECLKIPRSTVYDEIKRVRALFEKGRLREYLEGYLNL